MISGSFTARRRYVIIETPARRYCVRANDAHRHATIILEACGVPLNPETVRRFAQDFSARLQRDWMFQQEDVRRWARETGE